MSDGSNHSRASQDFLEFDRSSIFQRTTVVAILEAYIFPDCDGSVLIYGLSYGRADGKLSVIK